MSSSGAALSEARLAAIVESSDDAILSKDRNGIITSWNPAAERMYGYTADEAIGQPISIVIPDDHAGEEWMILDRILSGERVDLYESERVHRSGRRIRVSLSVSPIRDESGEIVGASVIAHDVTDSHRSREFAARLQELTAALSAEITREGALARLLEHATAGLGAQAGAVGFLDEVREEIKLVGAEGYTEEGVRPWQRFPLDADMPMSEAIRTGEAVWTESAKELATRYPAIGASNIRFGSLAVIPLAVGDRPFGAVSLSFAAERSFEPQERTFFMTAAQQAAQALDRARLYEGERVARERLSFLAEASELLGQSLDLDTTLRSLADLAIREVADWCGIDLVDEDGSLRNVATAHSDPAQVRLANDLRRRYPVDPESPTGVPHVIRTGEPELFGDIRDEMLVEAATDEEHLRLMRELQLRSAMVVPLGAGGRVLGALTLVRSDPERAYDEDDLTLATELGRRAGMAIDNSMRFDREHQAALTLQRSLLPDSLPQLEGLEFAAEYAPAAAGLEVGGDWYDVVAVGGARATMTIGDIAGRGVKAAAVMGRVAATLRAYVLDGATPEQALARLNDVMRSGAAPEMATLFHLELDANTGAVRYVRAGHPPGLLRHPDGRVQRLDGEGTPPLGLFDDLAIRHEEATLPPGGVLFLYTDGLIERRDTNFDRALERLCAALADAPRSASQCVRRIADQFGAGSISDDVALLAVARANGTG